MGIRSPSSSHIQGLINCTRYVYPEGFKHGINVVPTWEIASLSPEKCGLLKWVVVVLGKTSLRESLSLGFHLHPLFEDAFLLNPPTLREESLVLGLFRKNSGFLGLIRQTEPILLVVMYGLWPQVTIRTLRAPSCIQMPGVDGIWAWVLSSDPDIPCWESEHWRLILITGLAYYLCI